MFKRLLAGAVAIGALLVFVALPAGGQGYVEPNNLTRSGEACAPGGDLTLTADGAAPGTDVTFIFDGPPQVVLGVVTADANGVAVLDGAWPDDVTPGFYDVSATGTEDELDGGGELELIASVECGFAGAPAGSLPRTGSDSLPWVRIGVVLVALGGVVLLTSRRRHSAVREPYRLISPRPTAVVRIYVPAAGHDGRCRSAEHSVRVRPGPGDRPGPARQHLPRWRCWSRRRRRRARGDRSHRPPDPSGTAPTRVATAGSPASPASISTPGMDSRPAGQQHQIGGREDRRRGRRAVRGMSLARERRRRPAGGGRAPPGPSSDDDQLGPGHLSDRLDGQAGAFSQDEGTDAQWSWAARAARGVPGPPSGRRGPWAGGRPPVGRWG